VCETKYSETTFGLKTQNYNQRVVDLNVFKDPVAVCAPLSRLIADLLSITKNEEFAQELGLINNLMKQ